MTDDGDKMSSTSTASRNSKTFTSVQIFILGTSGVTGTATIETDENGNRTITKLAWRAYPIFDDGKSQALTWGQARRVWIMQRVAQVSQRTLIDEVMRVTGATFKRGRKA